MRVAIEAALRLSGNEIKFRAELTKDLAPVPKVWASEGKLAQVFLNLLLNAAHAIGDGNRARSRITVRTWSEGANVFSEVADTGSGISKGDLARVFDPFFTTKPVGKGTGLGLSICKTIIEELDGSLTIESAPGSPTRVTVRLPAAVDSGELIGLGVTSKAGSAAPPVPDPPPSSFAVTPATIAPPRAGRILVIDDEAEILKVTVRMLEKSHDVLQATSGTAARAILENDRAFDVILCDLMMADMTGIELHAWLLGRDPVLAAKVVFVTGGAFLPHTADYLANVKNRVLKKPFRRTDLLNLVAELLMEADLRI